VGVRRGAPDSAVVHEEPVRFSSDGFGLAGVLRLPEGERPRGGWPGLVFTGPLSGVKEQVVANYARRLTERGFVTLAFDHRRFGESDGEPRCHEDVSGRLADLRDALSLLAARPEVDAGRLGAVGVCFGGGFAVRFAAFDPRVRAVAGVAGGYNDARAMRDAFGSDNYRAELARLAQVAARQHATGSVEYLLAVDDGGGTPAVMGGDEPAAYYLTERGASPHWQNRLTALTVRELITADLAGWADFLDQTPLLVVHGRKDAYCTPDGAQAVHDRAPGVKKLVWLDTEQHIDLYDVDVHVEQAAGHCADWFERHL
jgi:uncharacterized protein